MTRNKEVVILATMFMAIIVIFIFSNKVNANSSTDDNGTIWEYTINEDGNAEIYKLSGEIPNDIVIPSYLEGYKVVKVRNRLFLLWFVWKL